MKDKEKTSVCIHDYPIEGHPDYCEDYPCQSCKDEDFMDSWMFEAWKEREMEVFRNDRKQ